MMFDKLRHMFNSKELFSFSEAVLHLVGFWPTDENVDKVTVLWATFNFCMLFSAGISELLGGVVLWEEDHLTALDAVCPGVSKLITTFKLLLFVIYRKAFTNTMRKVKELFEEEVSDDAKDVIRKTFDKVRIFNICLFTFGNLTNFGYFARPIANNFIAYLGGGELKRDLPFKVSLPYNTTATPAYQLTYAALNYTGIITVCGFVGMDGIFITLCLYLSSQFEVIGRRVRVLIGKDLGCQSFMANKIDGNRRLPALLTDVDNLMIARKIRMIVARHVELIMICKDVVKLFVVCITVHFLSAGLVIGLVSIQIVLSKDFGRMPYIFYELSALMQLFVYCIGGSYLIDSSTGIAYEIGQIDWYRLSPQNQRSLQLLLLQAQIGTRIAVPFFELSLATFASILSKAGSYIALLKTFL